MKKCSKCKEFKDNGDFCKNKNYKDGLHGWCKKCQIKYYENNKEKIKEHYKENAEKIKERKREHYKENAEKIKERKREHYKENPQSGTNKRAKRRVKICNQEITKEEWLSVMKLTNFKCFYCDCGLTKKTRTIDHIIPLSKGGRHCVDNLVPCCKHCNSSKHNKLFTEWDVIENLSEEKYKFLGKRIMDMICDIT